MSKTKLQRAVDATLEKYDRFLDTALKGGLVSFYWGDCGFCREYRKSLGIAVCSNCPIVKCEHRECGRSVLYELWLMQHHGHTVPAILAAMIYLHGFSTD